MAYLHMLVTDERCTGSFGGRSLAPALGDLQLRGSRINLQVLVSLLASETHRTRIAAR